MSKESLLEVQCKGGTYTIAAEVPVPAFDMKISKPVLSAGSQWALVAHVHKVTGVRIAIRIPLQNILTLLYF